MDEDVVDTCGVAWNLPVCALNQGVLFRPLGKEITFCENSSDVTNIQIPTSFLITFVALRKSSEVITGPPAAAAFTNHFLQITK